MDACALPLLPARHRPWPTGQLPALPLDALALRPTPRATCVLGVPCRMRASTSSPDAGVLCAAAWADSSCSRLRCRRCTPPPRPMHGADATAGRPARWNCAAHSASPRRPLRNRYPGRHPPSDRQRTAQRCARSIAPDRL